MNEVLAAENLSKSFGRPGADVHVLKNVSLSISTGTFTALMGPSGCGKSTLLNILGLADAPSSGRVILGGEEIRFSDERSLVTNRRRDLGYVFQYFNLLPTLTALENVMMPLVLLGERERRAAERAGALLERMGLAARAQAYPHTMSGGEMQRAAIARAVVHRPKIVLADEPTGNLDSASGTVVLDLLEELAREGVAVLMATHSESAAARCSRVVRLHDGVRVA